MSDEQSSNPYAAPMVDEPAAEPTGVEATRRKYLRHEASVKSVGSLYMLGAIYFVLSGLMLMGVGFSMPPSARGPALFAIGLGALYFVLGVPSGVTAVGLRRLRPWSRIVATILSIIGLLAFPVGTLVNSYVLYLLHSRKGRVVFSAEYRQVIEQTPHIKYRMSTLTIVLVVLLAVIVIVGAISYIAAP